MSHKRFTLLDPVVLYKEDLIEQKGLLREHLICDGCNFTVNAMAHGHELSAQPFHSVDELFDNDFPPTVDQLTIDARQMAPGGERISKSIRVLLDRKMADLRIYSDTDPEWVEQTHQSLTRFYKKKRPWFAGVKAALAPVFNITMVGAFFLIMQAAQQDRLDLALLPVALIIFSGLNLVLSMKNKTFAYCRVNLFPRKDDKRPNWELWLLLGWLTLVVLSALVILV